MSHRIPFQALTLLRFFSLDRMNVSKLVVYAAAGGTIYYLWKFLKFFTRPYFSPLRRIRCVPRSSVLLGSIRDFNRLEDSTLHEDWSREFGTAFRLKMFMNSECLVVMDPRALNHMFTHSTDYPKLDESIRALTKLLGAGILVTEGEKHRQQRRVMNPSFGPPSVRDLTPAMFEKTTQLRDIWLEQANADGKPVRIEVLSWLGRTTLDIIGVAGFNYEFNALNVNEKPNELNEAFSTIFNMDSNITIGMIIQEVVPFLRDLPTKRNRAVAAAMKTMRRVGNELVQERKHHFLEKEKDAFTDDSEDLHHKDLLSALIKANMDPSIPESQRMTDEEVLSQIPTFLVAGHETSSTQTTWTLFELAQNPKIQIRLREELLSVPTDTPSMDEVQALPYLDAVLRESLRLHGAVPATSRKAAKDDIIPLGEPIVDMSGNTISEICVKKGDVFVIPITAVNRMTSLWGPDAEEFNPDRWDNVPESATAIPSVFANVLSFLAGARGCIGYRFAVVEMKAILFSLIRSFEFELAIPADEFTKRSMVVTRPYLKSEQNGRAQMPLLVKPYIPSNL
ncbi:cytochrome P450 [Schizopora paradoxa]|uniref:Cytochrome P450 n=1 Tax=Schizopora paradoxa TaxID=27342 RepID=A0A0H2SIA9_9AGAM|nr:cytochrome P450 [Schizopora paradoxa]